MYIPSSGIEVGQRQRGGGARGGTATTRAFSSDLSAQVVDLEIERFDRSRRVVRSVVEVLLRVEPGVSRGGRRREGVVVGVD